MNQVLIATAQPAFRSSPALLGRKRIQEPLSGLLHAPGAVIVEDAVLAHHLCRRLIAQLDLILGAGREHVGAARGRRREEESQSGQPEAEEAPRPLRKPVAMVSYR
jgi:hypothetical protein